MSVHMFVNGELHHAGIKGMKWGVRRYQNKDGSLTPAGKKRYDKWADSKHQPSSVRSSVLAGVTAATGSKRAANALDKSNAKDAERWKRAKQQKKTSVKENIESEHKGLTDKQKEALKISVAVAGTAVAAYGVYKVSEAIKDKNFKRNMERGMKNFEYWAENGRWEVGMSQLQAAYDSSYKQSVGDIVKRAIDNNSVNGKVDWKNVRKTLL